MINELVNICGADNILVGEELKKHTTFRIGGPAKLMAIPRSEEEIVKLIALCKSKNFPYFVMGNGSNLLVSDSGYDGLVIQIFNQFNEVRLEGNKLYAQAGALLSLISNMAARAELTGMEALSGIPGTLGGAVVMNAGAYGREMKDIIDKVRVLNESGDILEINGQDMDFGYRQSVCMTKSYIVLGAYISLERGDLDSIRQKMNEYKQQRTSKQPLEYPSAGSTFKRPEGYFAGKLIMDAGLKGYCVGGAQVSEKHCGFVINKGEASCKDVMELVAHVQKSVLDKFGVTLEMEIRKLGEM